MFVLYFLYLYKVKNTHLLKSIFMEIPKYYKDTCNAYNRVYHVISLEEYKAKMFADNPKTKNLTIWDWLIPAGCFSNALFICDFNGLLREYGEWCNYCEGLIISQVALHCDTEPTVLAVHHSFIYSNKYECYVDCTLNNKYHPDLFLYLLSDELKEEALEKYLESLMSEDENGEDVTIPRFIHENLPLSVDVPKNWLLHRD